ncbi:MAG: GGDEF domain-containing response regulator [Candidatus Sericytochromatia bacterium]
MDKNQRIIIVDDEPEINDLIYRKLLENGGYRQVEMLTSIDALMAELQQSVHPDSTPVDLILMDVVMPDRDGIQGIQEVKRFDMFRDIPILMLTAIHDKQLLKQAFEAGAMDYITKPVDPVEFLARVGSAVRLKQEIDRRKAWEQELLEMTRGLMESNARLEQASFMDNVTGLLNRKAFDKRLQAEWIHCYVQKVPITLMLVEVDDFRAYNEEKGAVQGDTCLQEIASVLKQHLWNRVLLARSAGALFVMLFPGYTDEEAREAGLALQEAVAHLSLPHPARPDGVVTVSLGIAMVDPAQEPGPQSLLQLADLDLAHARVDQ